MATHLPHLQSGNAAPPRRSAPFEEEPGFYPEAGLWFYGNIKLLHARLAYVPQALAKPPFLRNELDIIERDAENLVLDAMVLVTGTHNEAHRQAAVVPLRWGAPRILVFSGGFYSHLGLELDQEPFPAARLWRFKWDARTDLAVSRRAPDKCPTYANDNPSVDRLVRGIVEMSWPGLSSPTDSLTDASKFGY